jgi:signal transduction histidine kinase
MHRPRLSRSIDTVTRLSRWVALVTVVHAVLDFDVLVRIPSQAGKPAMTTLPVPAAGRTPALAYWRPTAQATRGVVVGALACRVLVALVPAVVLAAYTGVLRLGPVVPLAAGLAAGNLLALVLAFRNPGATDQPTSILILDTAIAFVVNVSASASVPGPLGAPYHAPFWFYLVATVALVTATRGVTGGLVVVAAAIPLPPLMAAVNLGGLGRLDASDAVGLLLWLPIALVVALVLLAVVNRGHELAAAHGVHTGRTSERSRVLRSMHDTVLQALDAMSLGTDDDHASPEQALAELRITARRQAARLRRTLDSLALDRPAPLADGLAEAVDDVMAMGLRVTLALLDSGDRLDQTARDALRDAVREALTNTAKHSGASEAVVKVDAVDGGVEIVIRDHGCGFDVTASTSGFGIRESIRARMRDLGGTARIESWPGRGTRIRLWTPA